MRAGHLIDFAALRSCSCQISFATASLACFLVSSLSPVSAQERPQALAGPVVQTAADEVQGVIRDGVLEFLGIPFGQPVGMLCCCSTSPQVLSERHQGRECRGDLSEML